MRPLGRPLVQALRRARHQPTMDRGDKMIQYLNWPYAAKAIIQHEYQTNHLNLWLTFNCPMRQTVKPLDTVWLLYVDTVPKIIVSSAWQDAYTLLLTSETLASSPARVLLAYDGPAQNLRTTWDKQWDPWGPILSFDLLA